MCLKVHWMALVSMIVVALAGAAPAFATTASIADPAGDGASSADATTDLTRLDVVWDGSLRVGATYAHPPPRSSRLDILVSAAGRDEHDARVHSCDRDMGDSLTVTASGDQAQLAMPHVEGTLTVKAQRAASAVTYVFSSPVLTEMFAPGMRDPWVCVDGNADGDAFYGAFPGRALKLTPAIAQVAARAELTRRYGADVANSARTLIRCLPRAIDAAILGTPNELGRAALARCAFESRQGDKTRSGEVAVFLSNGVPQIAEFVSRIMPSALRPCGTTDFHSGPDGRRWLQPPFAAGFGGAYMTVWTQRVSCATARRSALGWDGKRRLSGYRCTVLKRGPEFLSVRCRRPDGRIIRWETGA